MGWRPGSGGTNDQPVPGAGLPRAVEPMRAPRPQGFAKGGEWDTSRPSAALAFALESVSGDAWRSPGATRDEMLGMLRQWQVLESWAAAGKLGLLRALIREDGQPLPGGGYHGDLPDGWTRSLTHEVALALSMPAVSAEQQMWLAWNLQAVLPGTGDLLAAGELTLAKARAVDKALGQLTDEDAAQAEAIILPDMPGKTYGQIEKLAVQAAIAVDPESATRRREDAERHRCRVQLFREDSGAAALSGRDMPTDQTLAAHANVCARAQQYRDSGVFDDDTRMDQFRVTAYLDLINEITAEARIASGHLVSIGRGGTDGSSGEEGLGEHDGPMGGDGADGDDSADGGNGLDHGGGPGGDDSPSDNSDPGNDGGPGSGGAPSGGRPSGGASSSPLRLADLVIPLATLLGLAERPGEGHGLGPLDPTLCRDLAGAAVASPETRLCVTVTGPGGIAIGHGCARQKPRQKHGVVPAAFASLPALVNLTITADQLAELAGQPATVGPPSHVNPPGEVIPHGGIGPPPARLPWAFARAGDTGPPGGHGKWTMTLPDGRNLTVELEPVPTLDCDHRHESHAYQPNDKLRHLVQVRDGTCTFPPCSRHARASDFEHAVPYDKGGRTCGCNAGARSRTCHQVKQSPGWVVTQPRPGWHQWQTPAGRVYVQEPKRYPA